MMLPPFGPKCLTASLIARIVPSTLVLNSRWNSSSVICSNIQELIDAGVVHQDVDRAKSPLGVIEHSLHVGSLGDVALHRDGFAASGGNVCNDAMGSVLGRRVVHYDGGACRAQAPGEAGADTLRRAGDDSHFAPLSRSFYSPRNLRIAFASTIR